MGIPDDNHLSAEGSRNWRATGQRVTAELSVPAIISNNDIMAASAFRDAQDASGNRVKYMAGGYSAPDGDYVEIFLPDAVGNPKSLLRFHRNAEDEVVAVSSEYDRRLVASLMEKALRPEIFAHLRTSLAGTKLDMNLTEEERADFKAYNDDYQQHKAAAHPLILAAEKLPSPPKTVFPLEKKQKVQVGEAVFVEAADRAQALEAYGAFENIILATYNEKEQRMGMLYINADTKPEAIDGFLTKSKGAATSADPVQVHVLGGLVTDNDMMGSVLERIDSSRDTLKLSSYCPYSSYGSLAICKNGNVFKELPAYLEQEVKMPDKLPEPPKPALKVEPPAVTVEKPLTQNDAAAILKQFPMIQADAHALPENGLLSAPLPPRARGNTPP